MKYLIIPAIIIIVSCATEQNVIVKKQEVTKEKPVVVDEVAVENYTDLSREFLSTCEQDIESSSAVISSKELIKSLSHLNHMGSGGKHYYLLEKQAITKMLNELGSYLSIPALN